MTNISFSVVSRLRNSVLLWKTIVFFVFLVKDFSFAVKNNVFFCFSGQWFQFYCEKLCFVLFFWFSGPLFQRNPPGESRIKLSAPCTNQWGSVLLWKTIVFFVFLVKDFSFTVKNNCLFFVFFCFLVFWTTFGSGSPFSLKSSPKNKNKKKHCFS